VIRLIALTYGIGMLFSPAVAQAQDSRTYVFGAPGQETRGPETATQTYEGGAGIDRVLVGHLGVMAEGSALLLTDRSGVRTVAGTASINGVVHILHDRGWDPFVTGGYSLIARRSTANAYNVGGGLAFWFREERALLIEFRDRGWSEEATTVHQWGVRIGLVFR
jgi:hypothetical protein